MGCIPTKSLLQTADIWERFEHADKEGISCENPRLDYPKVKERKDGIVNKHSNGVAMLLKRAKVERIAGYATLKGGGKVEVKSDSGVQTLEAKNIIIATGSEARMLPGLEPDADFILTNIEILNLNAVPKSLAIIGAGAVGVEFASIFNRFGSDVTVIEMLPRIVPVEDEDISKELERIFRKQKIRVETGARAENIQKTGAGRQAHAHHQRRQAGSSRGGKAAGGGGPQAQHGKHRAGEHPRRARPRLHQGGPVPADRRAGGLRHRRRGGGHAATGARGHARGDDRGGAHGRQARRADQQEPHSRLHLHRAGHRQRGSHRGAGARAGLPGEGRPLPVCRGQQATILGRHDGFVKVVSDERYGEILGVHIIGPEAFELIAEAVTAMEAEATVDVMMQTIHAHPTLYEALGEAFNAVYGLSINA